MVDIDKEYYYSSIPAIAVWDENVNKWLVVYDNGWEAREYLTFREISSSLHVRRSTIGLSDDRLPDLYMNYKIVDGSLASSENIDTFFEVTKRGKVVYLQKIYSEDDIDNYTTRFVTEITTDDSTTVCYGEIGIDKEKLSCSLIEGFEITGSGSTITKDTVKVDGVPVITTKLETDNPTFITRVHNIGLKPGITAQEIKVEYDNIKINYFSPPVWLDEKSGKIKIKPFIGALTSLFDTPLRPDLRW